VVLRDVANQVFDYQNITILATGMDHSSATNAAARKNGSEHVVDCSVHVDRGMMKKRGKLVDDTYLEQARRHVRMLVGITDPDIFLEGCKSDRP